MGVFIVVAVGAVHPTVAYHSDVVGKAKLLDGVDNHRVTEYPLSGFFDLESVGISEFLH